MSIARTTSISETLAAMEAALAGNGPRWIIQGGGDTARRRVPAPIPTPTKVNPGRLRTPASVQLRQDARDVKLAAHMADDRRAFVEDLARASRLLSEAVRLEERAWREADRAWRRRCASDLSLLERIHAAQLGGAHVDQAVTALHLHLIGEAEA